MRALRRLLPFALLPAVGLATIAACHSSEEGPCFSGQCGPTVPPNLGQSVTVSAVAPPPISGGTLTVSRDGRVAIVADPDRDRVLVVDLVARSIRSVLQTDAFAEPGRSVEAANGVAYVALRRGGKVWSIDLATGGLLAQTDVCPAPRGLAFDADRRRLHVACAGGELVTFQTPRGETPRARDGASDGALTEMRRLTLEDDLRDVVIAGDALLVSHFRSAAIDRVDGSGVVRRRPGLARGASNDGPAFDPTVAWRMVGTADGGAVVLHQQSRSDTIGVLDSALLPSEPTSSSSGGLGGSSLPASYYGGGIACEQVAVHTQITRLDVDGKSRDADPGHGSLANMPVPVDVAISRLGGFIAIVSAGQSRVFEGRLDLLAESDNCQQGEPTAPRPSGGIPTTDLSGGRMLPSSREPIAVAYGADDALVVQNREPSQLEIHEPGGAIVATIALGGPSRLDTAHMMFHSSPDATLLQISCASCHPEGRDDGHVWSFLDGPKRTQSLAGFSTASAPFHWAGDIPDVATLVDTIYTGRMGADSQSIVRKAALFDWLGHMPHAPAIAGVDGSAAARGRAIFEDGVVGCATCHAGPRYTDDRSVDVGTGGRFQTPSLRGVAARAPFMHDGCATTLRDRFVAPCGGGDAHGHTSELDPGQVDDLVAFMSTL